MSVYVCVCVCAHLSIFLLSCVCICACVCVRVCKLRTVEPVNPPWKAVNTPSKAFHIRTIQAPASLRFTPATSHNHSGGFSSCSTMYM